jgi:hypothetical protein
MNNKLIKHPLLLPVLDMPMLLYQFVRFTAMVSFAYLDIQQRNRITKMKCLFYIALAIFLFQPFIKIAGQNNLEYSRCITGIGLVLSFLKKRTVYKVMLLYKKHYTLNRFCFLARLDRII